MSTRIDRPSLGEGPHLVVGYGSLMHADTLPKGCRIDRETRVTGWKRGWNYRVESGGYTACGVTGHADAIMNAVLLHADPTGMRSLDRREELYHRVALDPSMLDAAVRRGTVWLYVPADPKGDTESYPVPQSYADVVLAGAVSRGMEFATEFLKTTAKWSWLHADRAEPVYPRALTGLDTERFDVMITRAGFPTINC